MKKIQVSRNELFKIIIENENPENKNVTAIVKLEDSYFESRRGYDPPEDQSGTVTLKVINFKF